MEILLSARNLKKSFGAQLLFEGVSFGVHVGDRIGLIGPNGAGKSTLLALLAGEGELDEGEIARRKGLCVGRLQQTPTFAPGQTVEQALREGAKGNPDAETVAAEVFRRVGLDGSGQGMEAPVETLSGGWRKRVALGRELARRPDLLLLDEPTNHLDIESILWLEEFVARSPFAVVTITHDRAFLQKVSNRILELDRRNPGGLLSVDGDYRTYVERKELLLESQKATEDSLRNRLRRETEWLRRGAKARTTKQQARIHRAEALADEVNELGARNQTGTARLDFGGTERRTKRLIEGKGLKKVIGERTLFSEVNVFLGPGTRLGILGPNGCGKSTLIRVLLGQEKPDGGTLFRADGLRIAHFEQGRESLDPKLSVTKAICPSGDHVHYRGRAIHVAGYLDRFLFRKEQRELPVGRLSGGEQARLLLARLMLNEADILVLDEPTNDLDMPTLDVLQQALEEFPGALVLVSHDRYFLDQVSDSILAFTDGRGGTITFAELSQWEQWRKQQQKPVSLPSTPTVAEKEKKRKKLGYNEQRELDGMEKRIQTVEAELAALTREAESPEVATQASRLAELYASIAVKQSELEALFQRWQELETLRDG